MALTLSSHFLDGMLGRACVLFAVAMLCGVCLWRYYLQCAITAQARMMAAILLIGLTGVALSLNSTFFQLAEVPGEEIVSLPWQDLLPLLLQTNYGRYWLLFSLLLALSWFGVRHARWMLLNILALIICLSMNSHAVDDGSSITLLLHIVHLGCVLLWWGGLMMLMLARYAQVCQADRPRLLAFSHLMLPVFLTGLVSGILRLSITFFENQVLDAAYWTLLAVKGGLVCAIMTCAWRLRQILQPPTLDGKHYDDTLSMEFFFAVLLLLAAATLTQLPPL